MTPVSKLHAGVRLLALLLASVLLLLAAAVACGDDDDAAPAQSNSPDASGTEATATATPLNGDGGQTSAPPDNGGPTLPTAALGTGQATIDGVSYSFEVDTCSVGADGAYIIGFGSDSTGVPIIGTATWFGESYLGIENAIEVGIGVNAVSLLEIGDQVYKMGQAVEGSAVEDFAVDAATFQLTASGMFVDLQAPDDPPVEGAFTVACGN